MICSNGPSLQQKEEVEKFLLAVVARFKAYKRRVQSKGSGAHAQRAPASKAKSSVLSQISGLENVLFNDFIDDELDSEDESEQRASAVFRLFITERKGNIHWNVPSRVEASKAALKQLPACHATRGKTEEPYDPQRTTT